MLNNFLIALCFTIIIEITVSLFFKIKNKYLFLSVIFINLVTNLSLNYVLLISSDLSLITVTAITIIILEILIVMI